MSLDPHGRLLLTGIAGRGLPDHFFEPIDRLEFGKEAVAIFLSSVQDVEHRGECLPILGVALEDFVSAWESLATDDESHDELLAVRPMVAGVAGAIPKSGDFDSAIRSLPGTTCDTMVEDPRSAFNFAGKIHLPTTVSGESSVSENLAP